MMTPDLINASFEGIGAFICILNIIRLNKDKIVRGVHWIPIAFWSAWGFWNIYYYSHLDQWLSWGCGIALVTVNTIWLVQMIYYIRKEK